MNERETQDSGQQGETEPIVRGTPGIWAMPSAADPAPSASPAAPASPDAAAGPASPADVAGDENVGNSAKAADDAAPPPEASGAAWSPPPPPLPSPSPADGGQLPQSRRARWGAALRGKPVFLGAAATGAAILLLGVGFIAGTQFGDRGDTARLVSGRGDHDGWRSLRGDRPERPFGFGEGHSRGRDGGMPSPGDGVTGAAMTVGQIASIKGSTLTVNSMRGNTVTVTTSSSTVVDGKSGGDLSVLNVGETVFATGALEGDRTLVATRISTGPAGMGHGRGPGGAP